MSCLDHAVVKDNAKKLLGEDQDNCMQYCNGCLMRVL